MRINPIARGKLLMCVRENKIRVGHPKKWGKEAKKREEFSSFLQIHIHAHARARIKRKR